MMPDVSDSSLNNDRLEYELPKVEAFDEMVSKRRRPEEFKLYEKFGDRIFEFGTYYYALDMVPDEQAEKLKFQLQELQSSCCHDWICRHVGMKGTAGSMRQYLQDKRHLTDERSEFSSAYLEVYLGMSFHKSPEA